MHGQTVGLAIYMDGSVLMFNWTKNCPKDRIGHLSVDEQKMISTRSVWQVSTDEGFVNRKNDLDERTRENIFRQQVDNRRQKSGKIASD